MWTDASPCQPPNPKFFSVFIPSLYLSPIPATDPSYRRHPGFSSTFPQSLSQALTSVVYLASLRSQDRRDISMTASRAHLQSLRVGTGTGWRWRALRPPPILLQAGLQTRFGLREEGRFWRLPVFSPKFLFPEESGSLNLPLLLIPSLLSPGSVQKPTILEP